MTAEAARRPWWRKKRWRLALAFWLALPILYPLSVGPAIYVATRHRLPVTWLVSYCRPAAMVPLPYGWSPRYRVWWYELAIQHDSMSD